MQADPIGKFNEMREMKKERTLCVQIAPAVRVALGEEFGMPLGADVTKKLIWALRKLGAEYVFDTPLGADIIAMEEANELKEVLEAGGPFPVFTSCCAGWMLFWKRAHPELEKNVCELVAPQMALGALIKTYFARESGMKKEPYVLSIMPCLLKEQEAASTMRDGRRYVDCVFTTKDIAKVLKSEGIDLKSAEEEEFDKISGMGSSEGAIFGASGGVMEAALQNLGKMLGEKVEFKEFRNEESMKKGTVKVGKYTLNIAAVWGLPNVDKLLAEMKEGKIYHFVEVMACPGGCIGGGGQPLPPTPEVVKARAAAMRKYADMLKISAKENAKVDEIYRAFLKKVGSEIGKELFSSKRK